MHHVPLPVLEKVRGQDPSPLLVARSRLFPLCPDEPNFSIVPATPTRLRRGPRLFGRRGLASPCHFRTTPLCRLGWVWTD